MNLVHTFEFTVISTIFIYDYPNHESYLWNQRVQEKICDCISYVFDFRNYLLLV